MVDIEALTQLELKLHSLAGDVRDQAVLERTIARKIRAARAAGASWQQIGDALGVTKHAANLRHGWGER